MAEITQTYDGLPMARRVFAVGAGVAFTACMISLSRLRIDKKK